MARTYKLSLGVSNGKVAELHSRRVYTPESAEPALAHRNVHVVDPKHDDGTIVRYRDQFNETFAGAIERYNSKQKRKRLKKSHDYYDEIDGSKRKEKPIYATIIQIGNRDTAGVTDVLFDEKKWKQLKKQSPSLAAEYVKEHLNTNPQREAAKQALIEIAEQFETWYPNMHVVSAILHDDEPCGSCHLDVSWIPVAGGEGSGVYKGGMDTRCALNKALEQMGITGKGYDFAIKHWQADIKTKCEEVMLEHGIEREFMNNTDRHKDIATYKMEKEREEEAMKLAEIKRRQEVARMDTARLEALNKELNRKNAELEDREEELERSIRRKKNEIADLDDTIERNEQRANRAAKRVKEAQEDLVDIQAKIDAAKRRLNDAKEEEAQLAYDIESQQHEKERIALVIERKRRQQREEEQRVIDTQRDYEKLATALNRLRDVIQSFMRWLRHKMQYDQLDPTISRDDVMTTLRVLDNVHDEWMVDESYELEALQQSYDISRAEKGKTTTQIETINNRIPATGKGKTLEPVR